MADVLSGVMDFFFQNIIYFVVIGVAGFLIYTYLKINSRPKPVDRRKIVRDDFKRDLEYSYSKIKWLYKGEKFIGKIERLGNSMVDGKRIYKIQFRKTILNSTIVNPFNHAVQLVVSEDIIQKDENELKQAYAEAKDNLTREVIRREMIEKSLFYGTRMILPTDFDFDQYIGIRTDAGDSIAHKFIQSVVYREDLENQSAFYYATAQENATINPEQARAMELKEKEYQIEMAKRKSKASEI